MVVLLKIGKSTLGYVVCQIRRERQDLRVVICSTGNAVNTELLVQPLNPIGGSL